MTGIILFHTKKPIKTWKKYVQCMIQSLRFHDTRYETITRLSKKLDIYELARMVEHRNLEMLMIYYNETAKNYCQEIGIISSVQKIFAIS